MLSQATELFGKIKDFVSKWYFLASALAIAIFAYLLDSKGKEVKQLNDEMQLMLMQKKLQAIKDKADTSEANFQKSSQSYDDLKRQHPELFNRILQSTNQGPK